MTRKNSRVVSLFGLPISNVSMERAVASIESRIRSGGSYQIATANLDFVRNARRNPELHRVICECAMVLPDGFPLVWASRLMKRPLHERVAGSDLTVELAKLSAEKGYGIFLLGSTDENAQDSMRVLSERFPGVNFVGHYAPPPRPLDQMDNTEILHRIHAANPHILLVAFGNPKQEFWIHRNMDKLRVPVAIGIGGTLEMVAGAKKRAPRWIQAVNLEWAYRMMQEPMRLIPRYWHDIVALVRYLPREVLAQRLQWKRAEDGAIRLDTQRGQVTAHVRGALTGSLCREVRDLVTDAIRRGENVTVDLAEATQLNADGLGCLLDARRTLQNRGLDFYIVSPNGAVRRILDASALQSMLHDQTHPQRSPAVSAKEFREETLPQVDRLSA
ncbi:WecB/TagA/CpsF family glycosyltransferase [Granulicella cerasi]|uniref:WecB/TagA/CpsF family glycosyltransferase n=1 Tax=Granulicella cerasi TaxID=741063 RepID=A0ABW1ZCB3_9BACT|nr:WecB/TagA/CpsF family glycosyltransferase [Granulicella cerasi]